jgi:hypothetical protein
MIFKNSVPRKYLYLKKEVHSDARNSITGKFTRYMLQQSLNVTAITPTHTGEMKCVHENVVKT